MPTGETAVFLFAGDRVERRLEVVRLFREEHRFHMYHVVGLEGAGNGEPFLSGQLRISEDFLYRLSFEGEYKPDYNMDFLAKRISTALNWEDVVLSYYVREELEEINNWITGHRVILSDWGLSRFLKAGYRTLFYGPPGTGKTLCATLIGKKNGMDVYRIDLSVIVSKYIGETEKNLANVFDQTENRNWIPFSVFLFVRGISGLFYLLIIKLLPTPKYPSSSCSSSSSFWSIYSKCLSEGTNMHQGWEGLTLKFCLASSG